MAKQHRSIEGQLDLFPELAEPPGLEAQPPSFLVRQWGEAWPALLKVGTSSWNYPGWEGTVYARRYSDSRLSKEGLTAYAAHPLFGAVGIDRTYYMAMSEDEYRRHAEQVPDDFRFLVKGPERVTIARFPRHARYGDLAGQDNPDFLNAELARATWAEPAARGLGDKLGALLLQFSPTAPAALGGASGFAVRLHRFLEQLPEGLNYTVEVRNKELLIPAYFQVLQRLGASHCLNVHPNMPDLRRQFELAGPQPLAVIRWMLGNPPWERAAGRAVDELEGWDYATAERRYQPFNRLVDEDLSTRAEIVSVWRDCLAQGSPVLTLVSNKAEGCSPLSVERLAEEWFAPPAPF